jgi:hypothetical protein
MEEEKVPEYVEESISREREVDWERRLENAYETSPEEYNRVFDQIEREKRELRAKDNPDEFLIDDVMDDYEEQAEKRRTF